VLILTVKTADSAPAAEQAAPQAEEKPKAQATPEAKTETAPQQAASPTGDIEVKVPDLGVDKAAVAEILVQVGDTVEKDQSIIVVESDKATVEVPSTTAGVIKAIHVELGQNVSEGVALITIEAEGTSTLLLLQRKNQKHLQLKLRLHQWQLQKLTLLLRRLKRIVQTSLVKSRTLPMPKFMLVLLCVNWLVNWVWYWQK
jgi:Pyruvate/2-oxoglutarate dehydrogenase complex, dihydrolipoamide acyltransferase (E2) component, and related enzymes